MPDQPTPAPLTDQQLTDYEAIADRAADDLPPAATCSAQYHGPGEDRARLCIRAAQHERTAHTDEHGFHWSDTVALYPLADGTFHTGVNVRARFERVAEAQPATPDTETPVHLGDRANAENCPGCKAEAANLPYPFLCPAAPGAAATPETEQPTETVHGCPPPGSSRTPCCDRLPWELPRTDRISSEQPVTCTGTAPETEA